MPRTFTPNEYAQLRDFFSREFGLFFEPSKVTYLENRIFPFLKSHDCLDINDFIGRVQGNQDFRGEVLNAVTTNETWFFRHPRHFDILREDVLPQYVRDKPRKGPRDLRIWSAGCSIGAEAFSIAITILEIIREPGEWHLQIIGSDISREALGRARQGIYSGSEVKLLSNMLLSRYFIPLGGDRFQIKPEVRGLVTFEELNLLDPWPNRTFDIIFCRNTMIYFREATKIALTERFYKALNLDGVFFTSATETLHWEGGEANFERAFLFGEYIYRRRGRLNRFVVYRFAAPSELLRALNLLVKFNMEYRLQNIPQATPTSPRKALYIPKPTESSVERMFAEADIRCASREEVQQ